ncbi:MAG: hypothetical protein CSA11_05460 [Chloroflexi bacterium]|nr:MAG: hypothetical protein CSA11_05460 [Chloroflexota bacterium]
MIEKLRFPRLGFVGSVALLLVFLCSALPVSPTRAADEKWYVRYYANMTLSGDPVQTGYESNIDHIWDDGSPGTAVPVDNFSAKWTRRVYFSAGTYRFSATMDDGMRVWVNDNEIISSWNNSQAHTVVADIYISEGEHDLKVEYYEATGGAVAQFSWERVSNASDANWLGQYFNNRDLFGQPSVVRHDAAINFDWGTGRPADGINADDFSVRWTGTLQLDPGLYRFSTTTDDGVRLWVNDQLLIDKWQSQSSITYTANVTVGGSVAVKLEYFEDKGQAVARLNYTKVGVAGGAAAPAFDSSMGAWQGTYYNNTNLENDPVMVRTDQDIDFIWGSSSPQPNMVNSDRFSVRWVNTHNFAADRYRFTVYVDGGVRLWVNDQLIIDEWKDPYKTVAYANILDLPGGSVPLIMEFFDDVGQAEARLVVTSESGTAVSMTTASANAANVAADLAPLSAQVVNARALNVRTGPSMDADPFTHVSGGQLVELTGCRSGGWIEIYLLDRSTGWVGGSYLAGNFNLYDLQSCVSNVE